MDFYSAIKPLYYISKVTGVAQFSYTKRSLKTLNGNVVKTNDLTPSGIFWSLFIFLVHALGLVSVMIWNFLYDSADYSVNFIVTDTFALLLLYGSSLCCLIMVGIVHREDIIQILKKCSLLDTILLQDNRQHVYKKVNNFLVVELSVCVVALLLSYGYHVSSWANGISIVPFASRDLAHFTGTVVLIQYVDIVLLLWNRFKKLNERLFLLCDNSENNLCRSEVRSHSLRCNRIAFIGDAVTSSPWKQDCTINYYKSSSNSRLVPSGSHWIAKEVIRDLRVMHGELVDICELVNCCYGLHFSYY
jgi:hypothetical protein